MTYRQLRYYRCEGKLPDLDSDRKSFGSRAEAAEHQARVNRAWEEYDWG